MLRRMPLWVLLVLILVACSPNLPTAALSPASSPSPIPSPTETAQNIPALQSLTETPIEVSSVTPVLAFTPTMAPEVSTEVAQLGPMAALNSIAQYYDPVGTPLTVWRGVSIMPEATAGEEYPPYIYSYKASASLEQIRQYYTSLAQPLGLMLPPAGGSAGTGAMAVHNITFFSNRMIIVLTSFDNDPVHSIVVISKAP